MDFRYKSAANIHSRNYTRQRNVDVRQLLHTMLASARMRLATIYLQNNQLYFQRSILYKSAPFSVHVASSLRIFFGASTNITLVRYVTFTFPSPFSVLRIPVAYNL
jgi:hypothetical protein